jgi:uncharacterized protein YndB with AHSA1/START domain
MTAQTERGDGKLIQLEGDRVGVRFVRRLSHPPERVWRAITDRDQLAAWFPADIEGELTTVGAELSFPFREGEAPTESGKVLACEPPRLLAYSWGDETLRFELDASPEGCRLTFTHALDREQSAHTAAGWEACFQALDAALAGRAKPDFSDEPWKELQETYAAKFGVDPEVGRKALEEYKQAVEAHRKRS